MSAKVIDAQAFRTRRLLAIDAELRELQKECFDLARRTAANVQRQNKLLSLRARLRVKA